jgi:hypothetical protein
LGEVLKRKERKEDNKYNCIQSSGLGYDLDDPFIGAHYLGPPGNCNNPINNEAGRENGAGQGEGEIDNARVGELRSIIGVVSLRLDLSYDAQYTEG